MEVQVLKQKSLERVVSQRALQMGSSFPCQICVVVFLSGVCLTSLFLATLTSFGSLEFGGISFSSISMGTPPVNSSSDMIKCKFDSRRSEREDEDERVSLLYSAWSALLTDSVMEERGFLQRFGIERSSVPNAPHFEDCKLSARVNTRLDTRSKNGNFLPWTSWKGRLDMYAASEANEQIQQFRHRDISEGSDEDNYPLTRKVQRDLWVRQHPSNCSDPGVRFLVADWERSAVYGIGAQIAAMVGLLATAINEKRVLVTNYYNRADHDGCKGSSRSSWSCYFFPETSQECRDRAFELMRSKEALEKGILTTKSNYSSKQMWAARTPRQPTTEINGSLITYHRKMDRRWWRAQAVRYLMRYKSDYMCGLMNDARHAAFGKEAAKMVLASLPREWPEEVTSNSRSDIEEFVWSSHKPWIPRPLLSMHVRMGDKACEMKVVEFEEYARLADHVRKYFPHLNSIWLSTEMQEVVDKTKLYPYWKFYYTNVTRQVGNIAMGKYEASLGRETSTNYPFVNFLMATEADFFIGALGSTWCFFIDGMRNTGGKVTAGYLSVNKDRFW
ncbi:hypothetical protein Pint_20378 [Pistacia integerrima]|uniref:Uncharacterized protein n=1 Tax=Pistacia integerrima TaxID=434235 RepID=A0ACC0XDD7_9ROSI|nr:hypothetical protein Pint_20378 [Pistacia integerrima]